MSQFLRSVPGTKVKQYTGTVCEAFYYSHNMQYITLNFPSKSVCIAYPKKNIGFLSVSLEKSS